MGDWPAELAQHELGRDTTHRVQQGADSRANLRLVMLESSYAFALTSTATAAADIKGILVGILGPLATQAPLVIAPERAAHLLIAAVPGFKQSASSVTELQHLIEDLVTVVLASLHQTTS
jgi:hypothetical protein